MGERQRYIKKKGREKKDGLPSIVLSQRMMRFPHGEMAGERIYPVVRGFTTSRERQRKCTHARSHNTHTHNLFGFCRVRQKLLGASRLCMVA